MNELELFLRKAAERHINKADNGCGCTVSYTEHVNDDAINGDAWLNNDTSYIWKVGMLGVVDGNKADWCSLYIAHQRDEAAPCELIGRLDWCGGENDDVGRCLERYVESINDTANFPLVFKNDSRVSTPPSPATVIKLLSSNGLLNAAAIRKKLNKTDSLDAITPEDIAAMIH